MRDKGICWFCDNRVHKDKVGDVVKADIEK
jgi:hypothetical protein